MTYLSAHLLATLLSSSLVFLAILCPQIFNHKFTNLFDEEVAAGCMEGPFTNQEAQFIYGGHFWTCPLGLVKKPSLEELGMISHFSKEDQFGQSTNSWVDLDNFPTWWFTAAKTADFVSVSFDLFAPYMPPLHYTHFLTQCIA